MKKTRDASVLILTEPMDYHSIAVEYALTRRGVTVERLIGSSVPEKSSLSIFINNNESTRLEKTPSFRTTLNFDGIAAIWNRRPIEPVLPSVPALDSQQSQYALEELSQFWTNFLLTCSTSKFCVNEPEARYRANSKARQLICAQREGIKIPKTLISGSGKSIRNFIDNNKSGTIYKPFFPHWFTKGDKQHFLFTSNVNASDLPEENLLSLTPGIYQEKIEKDHELRVTLMGSEIFTIKIDSSELDYTIDWRAHPVMELPAYRIETPPEVADACYKLKNQLGIVFGCFDFIVDTYGGLYFLEVNQMGNFLWIEELIPDVPMLSTFCDFILSGDSNFRSSTSKPIESYPVIARSADFKELISMDDAPDHPSF